MHLEEFVVQELCCSWAPRGVLDQALGYDIAHVLHQAHNVNQSDQSRHNRGRLGRGSMVLSARQPDFLNHIEQMSLQSDWQSVEMIVPNRSTWEI